MELFKKDSVQDLVLRGFDREAILSMTGADVGYHGNAVRSELAGVDRFAYKVEYVRANMSRDGLVDVLEKYATGMGKDEVLAELGIPCANIIRLKDLFKALGMEAEFRDADRRQRRFTMSTGFEAMYGTDNPFKLAEFQDRAAETRVEKYGAAYTLQKGSSLEPVARAKTSAASGTEETKARRRKTNMERYGVEHAIQSPDVRAKVEKTTMERYGVKSYTQTDEARKAQSERMLSRGGRTAVVLFNDGSPEDLLMRGFGLSEIGRMTGLSYRIHKNDWMTAIVGLDKFEYCVAYLAARVDAGVLSGVLSGWANNTLSAAGFLHGLGLRNKVVAAADFGRLFEKAGYGPAFRGADETRHKRIQDKIVTTNMSKYGVRCVFQDDGIKEKIKDVMVERYGVDNPSKDAGIQAKKEATLLEHYGVRQLMHSPELKARAVEVIREKYGVDNVSQSEEIKEKKRKTCIEHFGVEHSALDPSVKARQMESLCRRLGVEVLDGANGPLCIPEVREKARMTMLVRHGVDNPFKLKEIQDGIRAYWLESHGVKNPSQVPEIQSDRVAKFMEKYGVPNPGQNQDVIKKISDTKFINGTWNTSDSEEVLFAMLVEQFGADDVVRQYRDNRYPHACDFYIRSRDLFIELNGTWTHGMYWFGGSDVDEDIVAGWKSKRKNYYANAIENWVERDVKKRQSAKNAGLNYVVFWDTKLLDAELWFALGCPDGYDWEQEYSWVPSREVLCDIPFPESVGDDRSFIKAAKAANGTVFYERELKLWASDGVTSKGRVQGALFANRLKYHKEHKLPDELTDLEILQGLGIGRFVTAYTSFYFSPVGELLKKYGVKSVYDPCAGWGERMLGCGSFGIAYLGCDVNAELAEGYAKLKTHYGLDNCRFVVGDSAEFDPGDDHDCVMTCPPYGEREVYTEYGAENLSPEDFLEWWRKVVRMSSRPGTRYFIYQVDKRHADDMNAVLTDEGWNLIESVRAGSNQVRHENRAKGISSRRNFEAIYVFSR